ncbi:MAG: Protein translocase subunit SecY [uncultured Frankineae bacterium]|uniref:Protein translocase subunit SecY n=1 Tax=uncultured Frankineae bacterium TaxID=437475 RepID=A0A6J4L6P0_9ACTN|nr:MAG: Protein translocase subunit SecY [uncultured Frankineae bacterium]
MLTAFGRAFKTPDLRRKIFFTLFIIGVYRLGAYIPGPGVSYVAIQDALASTEGSSLYGLVNLFSGGALLQLSVFALGIMPYITASIILQLLVVVIPRLEELKKEGQSGQAKITQYTRYLTIALAVLQSTGIIALARSGRLFPDPSIEVIPDDSLFRILVLVITMTAGTAVIMWLGELITDRGVGNGMSVLIFTSIISSIPAQAVRLYQTDNGLLTVTMIALLALVVITLVVYVEQAQRRIPVQYAKRMIGRRMYGGTSTYIPLKVNQAGIIPVIFASSLLYLPQLLSNVWTSNATFTRIITTYLTQPSHPVYLTVYFVLIVFFTYFYVAITFNPVEVSDNMKKYGGFVPGIRPGRATAEYLDFILSRITAFGAVYLGLVAVLPYLLFGLTGSGDTVPFGGTAILIIVGVGLETVKQVESQLMLRNYEGFLR